MSIDPRLAERRREVAEDHARRNVRRLLRFLSVLAAAGALVWLALSPHLSVARVSVAGALASEASGILAEHRVAQGTPMVLIQPGTVEAALEADPWVIAAEVRLQWPKDVVVQVTERVPRAWVQTANGWSRRAEDGMTLPSRSEPDSTLGWVHLPTVTSEDAPRSDLVLGSIEFLMALPPEMAAAVSIRLEEGELWAVVDSRQVRLGRPVSMREKAVSLVALLEEEIPKSAVLVLVAPTHPAVRPTPGEAEGDDPQVDSDPGSNQQAEQRTP